MLTKVKNSKCSTRFKSACNTLAAKVQSGAKARKQQRIKKCVLELLQLYDPEKVASIDKLMSEWKNKELQLLQSLHQEYHLTDVGLTYFKSKYSRLFELPSIYKGTFCRQCIRRSNGDQRLYHRLYKKRVTAYIIAEIKLNINILKQLNHPNILKLYDIFESRTRIVLITDLLDYSKCNLPVSLFNKSTICNLNESHIANIFTQMIEVISYIHNKNYIHCNLNIDSFVIEKWSGAQLNEPMIKLIRADQCVATYDIDYNHSFNISDERFSSPEMMRKEISSITQKTDMWSLGIILYTLLCGMLPQQQICAINVIKFDANKLCWNHLSFHARDLCMKLTANNPSKRLSIDEVLAHPWLNRYRLGYLHNNLWCGYSNNLKKYQCLEKLREGIKKLLIIKNCLGLLDDMIPVNDVRNILNFWSREFEKNSLHRMFIPNHIKNIIVDFA